jgi:hypothetical protein
VSERLRRGRRGVRGGVRGFGGNALDFFFSGRHIFAGPSRHIFAEPTYFRDDIFPGTYYDIFPGPHDIRWFFGTWLFANGFLFPVKELGFWKPSRWGLYPFS